MKKSKKSSKNNSLGACGSEQLVFNPDGSFSSSGGAPKKSKKGSSKESLLMKIQSDSMSPGRIVASGEKRKMESSDESPKKKKKKKSADSDTSGHSERIGKNNSFSNSLEKSVLKPPKQSKKFGSESISVLTPTNSKKNSLQKSKSLIEETGDVFSSPIVKSAKKAKPTPDKTQKFVQLERSGKTSSGKHALETSVGDHEQESSESDELSEEEEDFVGSKTKAEDEMPIEGSSSMISGSKGDEVAWTEDQTLQLFEVMTSVLNIKQEEKTSFRQRMKKISWGNIPQMLDPPRTIEECVQHLEACFKKVKSIRNLSEMLYAHQVRLKNRMKFYVRLPMQRFRVENHEAITKRGGNYFVISKEMYDELSEEEKYQRYILPYQKELAEKNLKNPKKKKTATTHSSLHFYRERHPELSLKDAKLQFSSLSPKKRLPYIRLSYEEFKFALRAHEDLEASVKTQVKAPYCHLSKEEWVILLKSLGMPVMQAKGPSELFLKMNPDKDLEDLDLKTYFKNHPEKHKYSMLFAEMRENFKKKFEEWMPGVEDDLVKKPAAAYFEEVMNVRATTRKGSEKATVSMVTLKIRELEDSFVESSMVGNFPGEPKPPPMTAKECFADYLRRANPGVKSKEINEKYGEIAEGFKEKLTGLARKAVKGFKEQLMEFVSDLPVAERKIYVGQNRIKYIKLFEGVDIFEENYPCSEYPPFKKRAKTAPGKSPIASEEMSTLYDFWTPKRKNEEPREFDSRKLSTSTPMNAEVSSSQPSQMYDVAKVEDESESSSDEAEPSPLDRGDLRGKAPVAAGRSMESSSSSDSDSVSSDEDEVDVKHQPSPKTPAAMRDSKKERVSHDPLSPSKLKEFLSSAHEKHSSESVNGATRVNSKMATPVATFGQQKTVASRADSSSEEDSNEDEDEDDHMDTKLIQRSMRRSEAEDSSEDESEDDLVPAWSQK